MRSFRIFGLAALVALVANCGGSSGGPSVTPGYLTLTLTTPNTNDGAILFRVIGGTVDSVYGTAMVQDGSYTIQPTFTRIVAAGNIVGGVVAHLKVPDVAAAASYSVVMEQVAVRNTYTQRSLSGYSIVVTYP